MLVLSRKRNEKIHVGDAITITVVRIKGRSVQLGIEAPAEVPILRNELLPDSLRRRAPRSRPTVEAGTQRHS